jgi:hypothetical protein
MSFAMLTKCGEGLTFSTAGLRQLLDANQGVLRVPGGEVDVFLGSECSLGGARHGLRKLLSLYAFRIHTGLTRWTAKGFKCDHTSGTREPAYQDTGTVPHKVRVEARRDGKQVGQNTIGMLKSLSAVGYARASERDARLVAQPRINKKVVREFFIGPSVTR